MSQQPPESSDPEATRDKQRPTQDQHAEDERFVLVPEPSPPKRRWLSSAPKGNEASDYEPRQFDLSSLPDESDIDPAKASDSDSVPPLGYVSEPRPAQVRPAPRKPVQTASPDDVPPLGFVSEARPVRPEPQASVPPPPRLGFISRDEIEKNVRPAPAREPAAAEPDKPAAPETDAIPPLGYVSEPVVIARRPVATPGETDPAAALFENQPAESSLPPLEAGLASEALPPNVAAAEPASGIVGEAAARETPRPLNPSPELSAAMADIEELAADGGETLAGPDAGGTTASGAPLTAGMMLQRERIKRGLTQENIVMQTHMTLETIKALEEDRDPPQSAWVYVRGFYRRYAKALGIPEAPLLEAHQQTAGKLPEPEHVSLEWAPEDVSPKPGLSKHLVVISFSIGMGVLAWWLLPMVKDYVSNPQMVASAKAWSSSLTSQLQSTTDKVKSKSAALYQQAAEKVEAGREKAMEQASRIMEAAQTPAVATKPEPARATAPAPRIDPPEKSATVAGPRANESSSNAAVMEPAPAVQQATPANAMVSPPEPTSASTPVASRVGGLELVLSRQSWVSVTDVNGQLLFEGMLEGDMQRRFEGEPPLVLFLGTATAVQVRYNGQDVDLSSHLRPNGTARIALGEE